MTLRHLHLIWCILAAYEWDESQLLNFPAWAAANLQLESVEVFGLRRRIRYPPTAEYRYVEINPLNPDHDYDETIIVSELGFVRGCMNGRKNKAVPQARPKLELSIGVEVEDEVRYW